MAVCPDGKLIIAGMGIYLCNLGGRPHFRYLGGNRGSGHTLSALVLTPDGRYLIDAGWEGARLWDLSPLQRGEYPEPLDLDLYTFWLAVSPDARWLLGSCKGGIRIIPIGHQSPRRTLIEGESVRPATFSIWRVELSSVLFETWPQKAVQTQ